MERSEIRGKPVRIPKAGIPDEGIRVAAVPSSGRRTVCIAARRPKSRNHIRPIGTTPLNADDAADAARRLQAIADMQPPFSQLMGTKIVEVTRDRVVAEVLVREELTNRNGGLHGGAVMAIADNLGGTATFLNMPEGAGTTTIESKTNFFAAVPFGDTVRAECTPLHRGRTTMVWQTRIIRSDGKLAAIVIQTQLITRSQLGTPRPGS
jgi:uncharacterized protein (TIGR00369 family)